jgi:hypothetical protein
MGKLFSVLLVFGALYFFSCAPLHKKTCERTFLSIVKNSHNEKQIKKVRGSIYIKGVLLLFNASLKDNTQIDLFTPIGTRVARFYEDSENVCIEVKNRKICGKAPKMYREALSEEIPFSLTDIISGRFSISPESKYTCQENAITINDNGKTYIFEKGLLKKISYKDFSLVYEYKDGKPEKVILKANGTTLAKIFIRDLE